MKPWQERVVREKTELDDKIKRLLAFVNGDLYPTLPADERDRLGRQLSLMGQYSYVLAERIAAFED